MQEEKLGQLRTVFSNCVKNIIDEIKNNNLDIDNINNIEHYAGHVANQLTYEVKIRINNR